MRKASIADVYAYLDSIAPFEKQEAYDNSGLLVGNMHTQVDTALLALDVTPQVIAEARQCGAQLIISHHPLMFHAIGQIDPGAYEGGLLANLLKQDIALLAAHTNMDQTTCSGSYACAKLLGLRHIAQQGAFVFTGDLARPASLQQLAQRIGQALYCQPLYYVAPQNKIKKLAIAGGAGGDGIEQALQAGAGALLTGEIKHSQILEAVGRGLAVIAAGHYQTEAPMLPPLADSLQKAMQRLQYKFRVFVSKVNPYTGGYPAGGMDDTA